MAESGQPIKIGNSFSVDGSTIEEVVDGRGSEPTIGSRISRNEQSVSEAERFANQQDYVAMLGRMTDFDGMYYSKQNSLGWVSIMLTKGNKQLTYDFRTKSDAYMILGRASWGEFLQEYQQYENKNYGNVAGIWNTSAPNSHYTTEVGATFTTTVTGEKIDFTHYADNRGGVWEFIINGNTNNPILISTFSSSAGVKDSTIVEGLSFGTHSVVGTFKGADPDNAPSGGTARGWVHYSDGTNKTFRTYKTQLSGTQEKVFLVDGSNKEYAINMRKSGVGSYQFVPSHSGIATTFEAEPRRIIADGETVDVSGLETGEFLPCSELKVVQQVYGRNPDTEDENLVLITTNVTITRQGIAEIIGKFEALTAIEIADGYGLMLPVVKDMIDRAYTGIGNQYPCTATDNSRTFLEGEKDKTKSVAFSSSSEKDYVMAITYHDPFRTLRTGRSGKYAEGATAWIEHRDASLTKLYQSVFRNYTMPAGEFFSFSGSIFTGKVEGIYDLL